MIKPSPCFAALLMASAPSLLAAPPVAQAQSYVHKNGTSIVLSDGTTPTIIGVNLGNWFVPESYMFGVQPSSNPNPRFETTRLALVALAGSTPSDQSAYLKWRGTYLSDYVNQQDIKDIKALGFNTVRVPLDWRDLLDSTLSNPYTGVAYTYPASSRTSNPLPSNAPYALSYLDNLLDWCTAAGVYVLLDMHVTPSTVATTNNASGGTNSDTRSYVSSSSTNQYFNQVKNAWITVATRYKNATNILGYDLVNEPPTSADSLLAATYQQLITAIRGVDNNHMLVLESDVVANFGNGNNSSSDGFFGSSMSDGNLAISLHAYNATPPSTFAGDVPPTYTGRSNSASLFANHENVPLIVGETGELSNNAVNTVRHLWTAGNLPNSAGNTMTGGVLYWTYKKPGNSVRSVKSASFTPGWSTGSPSMPSYIANYPAYDPTLSTQPAAPTPLPANSSTLLNSQAAASVNQGPNAPSPANLVLHTDVLGSMVNDYYKVSPTLYLSAAQPIPGTVVATSFDVGLESPAATPSNYGNYAYYNSTATPPQSFQVRNDLVYTVLNNNNTTLTNGPTYTASNDAGDWQQYSVNVTPGTYNVSLLYGAADSTGQVTLTLNTQTLFSNFALASTGGTTTFKSVSLGTINVTASGAATLRISTNAAGSSGLSYSSVTFTK